MKYLIGKNSMSMNILDKAFRLHSLFKLNHTLEAMYKTGLRGTKVQW